MNCYDKINEKEFMNRLLAAHDKEKAVIRNRVMEAEYNFFREHIRHYNVLVCGSGLGHDSFELASYNNYVLGVELFKSLKHYAIKEQARLNINNVDFIHGDVTSLSLIEPKYFDVAVLNMGTMCNFSTKEQMRFIGAVVDADMAKVFYFDFYPPTKKAIKTRLQMYQEESWDDVSWNGEAFVSKSGLYSRSISEQSLMKIANELDVKIEFTPLLDFLIMAKVTK